MWTKIATALAPAPHRNRVPQDQIQRLYPKFRWAILESTFVGYATFYLVRNNFSTVAPDIAKALGYTHNDVGNILAVTALSYGLGKFFMGALSDRSNPKVFMPLGLLITAFLNLAFGSSSNLNVHLALWGLNGFVQGMGWPPCGRSMGHWFSTRERGSVFAFWNIAHNVGGGLAGVLAAHSAAQWGWRYAFHVPAILSILCAIYLYLRLEDTPQSVGLPPVEEYRNDYAACDKPEDHALQEKELTTRELLVEQVARNKILWLVALANLFVYVARYALLDWGPMYLREMKGATLTQCGSAVFAIEFGGIPSTLLMGWLSDKMGGRRGLVSMVCMVPVFFAYLGILLTPRGYLWLDFTLLAIVGLAVYPPVMLLGVSALDLTSKKAVGTAAGFVGLFGYIGRAAEAKGFGWMRAHYGLLYGPAMGWQLVLLSILGCTALSIVLLAFTRNVRPRA